MNTQLVRVKHLVRMNMFKAQGMVQKNWFKLVVALLVAFVIVRKDLNISFNLSAAGSSAALPTHQVSHQMPTPEKMSNVVPISDNTDYNESVTDPKRTSVSKSVEADRKLKKKAEKDNLANTFSNIGFVMNPGYAKRNNIDPRIVKEKKEICDNYIKKYGPIAVKEMHKYGIPASITLAQGLLESNAGHSRLAKKNNNHFGIKCFSKSCRKGHCANFTDDTHKDFFRKYNNVWESYRAHSQFLLKNRYKHLLKLKTTDYKSWAHGLRKAGYATDKKYAFKLIKLIEALDLDKFDRK